MQGGIDVFVFIIHASILARIMFDGNKKSTLQIPKVAFGV